MSGGGYDEMFLAPGWVTTSGQWASWWLSSKLRGPLLDGRDLGLTDEVVLLGHGGPRWSIQDLGAVTQDQIDRFAEIVQHAVEAETGQGGVAELTLQPGRSDLLARLATQAGLDAVLLPRVIGPWTITISAQQALMRPVASAPVITVDEPSGMADGHEGTTLVMWPNPHSRRQA